MPKVVIDPGHGGTDSGAVGSAQGLFESHAVMSIGATVRDILRPHMDVVMTRETDEFISLPYRAKLANEQNADAFVSLHLNSAVNADASGFEVFTSGSSNSKRLAGDILMSHAKTFPDQKSRGVKQASFYVLKHTTMPAVLWEGCFLSNFAESSWVADDSVREDMAQAVATGVLNYFEIDAQTNNPSLTLEQRVDRIEKHLGI